MIVWILLAVAWGACSGLSYWMFETWWRWDFELTRGDRRSFVVASLGGPVSLLIAVATYFTNGDNEAEVVKPQKPRA